MASKRKKSRQDKYNEVQQWTTLQYNALDQEMQTRLIAFEEQQKKAENEFYASQMRYYRERASEINRQSSEKKDAIRNQLSKASQPKTTQLQEAAAEKETKRSRENPHLASFFQLYGTEIDAFLKLLSEKKIRSAMATMFLLGDALERNEITSANWDYLNLRFPLVDDKGVQHTWQELLGDKTLIQCAICDQPSSVRSGCCAQIMYCGQECADDHWTAHEQQCIGKLKSLLT